MPKWLLLNWVFVIRNNTYFIRKKKVFKEISKDFSLHLINDAILCANISANFATLIYSHLILSWLTWRMKRNHSSICFQKKLKSSHVSYPKDTPLSQLNQHIIKDLFLFWDNNNFHLEWKFPSIHILQIITQTATIPGAGISSVNALQSWTKSKYVVVPSTWE